MCQLFVVNEYDAHLSFHYICPGKRVMYRLKLSIMFATLGQLTAEILVIFIFPVDK